MYEKLLSEAERYLESHKTKEVPILELWDEMAEKAEELKFDMPENLGDFELLIEADKRFVFVAEKLEEGIDEEDDVDLGEEEGEYEVGEDYFEVEKMEKLGFNQDQIVGLKKYEKKKTTEDDDDDRPASSSKVKRSAAPPVAAPKHPAAVKKQTSAVAARGTKTKSKLTKPVKRKK